MLSAIAQHQPALVYLAYPNNPTANLWDDTVIERIIEAAPGFVVIDEAYQPFASRSYMDRLARHDHVLLMRTMSKFGLAGVRIGYLVGPAAAIREIDKVRPPYNISVLNAECALFALEHADVFAAQARDIVAQRAVLQAGLAALPGVRTALMTLQRSFRQAPGLVADGRDMGSVVFPDARLKIYLTATPEERAQRRYKQLITKEVDASMPSLLQDIRDRDHRDSNRAAAPLLKCAEAIEFDTTGIVVDAVVAKVLQWYQEHQKEH